MSEPPLLEVGSLSKQFGPNLVLDSVSFELQKGRIYGLAGENGAGKSTLIKILSGVHQPSSGGMTWEGVAYRPQSVRDAERVGLNVFHQEIPICPNLSIAANVFLGPRLPGRTRWPDWRALHARCRELYRELLDLPVDPARPIGLCTAAERQLALLVRVLSRQGRCIILDEPTTALTPPETARLFGIIRKLSAQGITFLFVSHVLDELIALADEFFVLRDGRLVAHRQKGEFGPEELAALITGRKTLSVPAAVAPSGAVKLEVQRLGRPGVFRDISFHVRAGEVVGLAGLQGSGRASLAAALFAAPPAQEGRLLRNGAPCTLTNPREAVRAGIGYVPEDRRRLGLFDDLDVALNLGLLRLRSFRRGGFLRRRPLLQLTAEMQQALNIKMPGPDASILSLSGGNQQKVLLARWLAIRPEVLVLNEPTRGVDIAAKQEIWRWIGRLAGQGCALVVSSSDSDELLQLSDRLLVLANGRVQAEFTRETATKEGLVQAMGRGAPTSQIEPN